MAQPFWDDPVEEILVRTYTVQKHRRQDPDHGTTTRMNNLLYQRAPSEPYHRQINKQKHLRLLLPDDYMKKKLMHEWKEIIRKRYPKVHCQTYLKPAVHFNRVSYTQRNIGVTVVQVPVPAKQLSDVREDESQQRIHSVFTRLFRDSKKAMFIIFELDFDNYLNNAGNPSKTDREKKLKSFSADSGQGVGMKGKLTSATTATLHNGHDSVAHFSRTPTQNRHGSAEQPNSHQSASEPDLSIFARPRDLESPYRRGQFDILFICPHYGLMIFKVKAVGDVFQLSGHQSVREQYEIIRQKIGKALKQLDKEEFVLRYLVTDIVDDLSVTKGLILPNLKRQTVQAAVMQDPQLSGQFCRCLGTASLEEALSRCIFSDQLPPIGQSVEIDDDIIKYLESDWWLKLVGGASTNRLSKEDYESILARFCGPATVQYVSTAQKARAEVSTLSQAVLETSHCCTAPVLTSEQVEILPTDRPRVYLTGPPGTGKTLMLMSKGEDWLLQGRTVFVTSLWEGSEAASRLIFEKLSLKLHPSDQRLRFLRGTKDDVKDILAQLHTQASNKTAPPQGNDDDLEEDGVDIEPHDVEMAEAYPSSRPEVEMHCLQDNRQRGKTVRTKTGHYAFTPPSISVQRSWTEGTERHQSDDKQNKICLLIDEAPWFLKSFVQQLEEMLGKDKIVIWAASSFTGWKPKGFNDVVLTQSLRCPPVVIGEMMMASAYATFARHAYTSLDIPFLSGMHSPTDGPPVKRIHHKYYKEQKGIFDCEECGQAVATFLTDDLLIGKSCAGSRGQQQETLHFRDVLISGYLPPLHKDMDKNLTTSPSRESGFLTGLQRAGVEFEIIRKGDDSSAKKLASPVGNDCVQIAEPESIRGLERAVVVAIGTIKIRDTYPRLVDPQFDVMACCTSQLVVVGDSDIEMMFRKSFDL